MANLFKQFERNTSGRDFVVGDIHGYWYMLQALMAHVDFDESCDRLFSVGDLADHGPECERLSEFTRTDWFHAIRGNHEQLMMKGAHTVEWAPINMADAQLWLSNAGSWFFQLPLDDQATIYHEVQRLPYGIEVEIEGGVAGLVHGQVLDKSWTKTRRFLLDPFSLGDKDYLHDAMKVDDREKAIETLIWGRSDAFEALKTIGEAPKVSPDKLEIAGAAVVFFGHTPMPSGPVSVANTRWIDAGVTSGKWLAMAELSANGRVWCVDPELREVVEGWEISAR